jgi:DNA segregation ATPase FtsK/SpoIIIE, S-DNA-T family
VSNDLGAGTTLERLDNLKGTVQEFAARADKLNGDYHARTARERLRCQGAVEQIAREVAAAVAEADEAFQGRRARLDDAYEKRKVWIGRAYQTSKERALKEIDDRAGGRKFHLQKQMLQAERDREAALAASAHAFEEFRAHLATEQQTLAQLEGEAQNAFTGYTTLRAGFYAAYEKADASAFKNQEENQLLTELRERLGKIGEGLQRFRKAFLFGLLRFWLLWVVLALVPLVLVPLLQRSGIHAFTYPMAGGVAGLCVLALGVRALVKRQAEPAATALSQALATAHRLHEACAERAQIHHQQELERIKNEYVATAQTSEQELKRVNAEVGEARVACRMESDDRTVRVNARSERLHKTRVARLEAGHTGALQRLNKAAEVRMDALRAASAAQLKEFTDAYDAAWRALETEWKTQTGPIYATMNASQDAAQKLFPPWTDPAWKSWAPPKEFAQAAQFARLKVDLEKLCEAVPKDKRLALPGPVRFELPLCLGFPTQGSLLFETGATGHDEAIAALNNVILRLLSVAPAGRLNFSILDPVGLGQNFAGIMHMADYEEQIINSRIWTQSNQIEQRLADLNEHMEKVIQMYLRNEYQTIAEYNEQAGVIAEKYHFLVVADFPANFTETAIKRLLSIAASGARCGVYMLVHWDQRLPLPPDFMPEELRKSCSCVTAKGQTFLLTGRSPVGAELVLEEPPAPEMAIEFIQEVGRSSRDSSRVEVPFEHVVPPENEIWSEDTTKELRVPIGRTGATKLQYLAIGKGTCQHGLVAGKTGSGKSTLFHVIITNLALWCSPEQVEFYLVDFKKGVEFKCYGAKHLPHARVVAIESDREFGLSVLQRLDEELKRRGELFRQLGVQDIAGYKRAGGKEPVPRSLLLIDEFQEFFVEDDKIAQTASLLLDRIVRQGRAFGIHVLLGSQTLGGAYTVARTTLGQMVIRIALQCNEADAYLIMDDTNPAPRLLSRPGEGIYNDMAGALEGNSPFQVVWVSDEVRDAYLTKIRQRADQNHLAYPGPIVFEGNAPADVQENSLLRAMFEAKALTRTAVPRIWLGAPNSIKGPTEAMFQRQSGNNLLVVGQREEATLAMVCLSLLALAAQYPKGGVRLILCDSTPPGTPQRDYLERVLQAIPHPVTLAKPGDLVELMKDLNAEMKQRAEAPDPDAPPPVFLIIHGLQRNSRLRYEDDFSFSSGDSDAAPNPAVVLNNMVCEGTRLGFHVIATCDSYNNVGRYLSRKALSEFEMRVLFQMSANDSASLIDNPKASLLGLHRALFYNAQEGYLETFRPYALPSTEWLEGAARQLARLLSSPG